LIERAACPIQRDPALCGSVKSRVAMINSSAKSLKKSTAPHSCPKPKSVRGRRTTELAKGILHKENTMYDMKNLTKLKKLGELAPEAFKGFVAFDEAVFKEGAIPLKYKELMAVAVALTTQCPYCIEIHSKKAKKAGVTEQELAETTLIAAALRAGGAVTHGTHTLE
jgi:AhpD family alkylhydroperoxidase